jgi:hypothetical protein
MDAFIRAHEQDFRVDGGVVYLKKKKPVADADGWTTVGSAAATADGDAADRGKAGQQGNKSKQQPQQQQQQRADDHLQEHWGV